MHRTNLIVAAAVTLATALGMTGVAAAQPTETAINHVIVIFQENVSFDHYFGTYPNGQRPDGSTADQQSERRQSVPVHACAGRHM